MRRNIKWLVTVLGIMLVVLLGVTACGKSNEKQIAEQLELGNKYLAEMDYEQAIVAFNKVIELDPKQIIAYEKLADSYIGLDRKEEAVDILCQGVSAITEAEAGTEGQALKERAVTLCEELLQTYLVTNTDEANRYYEQLKQLDEAKAAQYENELQQAFVKEKIKSNYEDSLKNARAQISGDAWETLSVDQFSWKFELANELDDEGLEDIIYDYGDGTYLQVTKNGYVYYGKMKDGKRDGDNGIWFQLRDNGYKYCFKGTWQDGYPNGSGEERNIEESSEYITTGTWRNGLENGKMQLKFISSTWNEIVIFKYSVFEGMPKVIDQYGQDDRRFYVVSYSTGEKNKLAPWDYGYNDESKLPWGIIGCGGRKWTYINTTQDIPD